MSSWTSRIPQFNLALIQALQEGITEAAEHYEQAVRDQLEKGYTSGKFTTGATADSVYVSIAEGEAMIATDERIALYWELGFHDLFTKSFQRQEVWLPVFEQELEAMIQIIVSHLGDINV